MSPPLNHFPGVMEDCLLFFLINRVLLGSQGCLSPSECWSEVQARPAALGWCLLPLHTPHVTSVLRLPLCTRAPGV